MDYKHLILEMGFKEDQLPKDDDATADVKALAVKLNTTLKDSFKNDKEFTAPFESAAYGRVLGEAQRKLKKDLELDIELTDTTKIDDVVTAAKLKMTSSGTVTVQDAQKKFAEKEQALMLQLKEKEDAITGIKAGYDKEKKQQDFFSHVKNVMGKHKLTAAPDVLLPYVQTKLSEQYDIADDPKTGKLTLLTKGGSGTRPQDGHKILTDDEVISKVLESEKLILKQKVGSGANKSDVTVEDDNEMGTSKVKFESEGSRKIRERLQSAKT